MVGLLRHQETIRSELRYSDSVRLTSSTEKRCLKQVEEKKSAPKRDFALKTFRSSSDSKIGSRYRQGILKVDTALWRKNPDSPSRRALPEVQGSLPNRKVGFQGTVTIIDTARKNSVPSSNPAVSETLRSIRNNEANSGTIVSRETSHRYPSLNGKVSSTQTLLGRKGNERRAPLLPSVA